MPIYDYVCDSCRHRIEVIHGINDPGPRFCPNCGLEGTLRKALSTPAIHFKGSGWAKKDRSSSSGARARSGTSTSSDDGAASTSGSSDGPSSGDASGSSSKSKGGATTESGTGATGSKTSAED